MPEQVIGWLLGQEDRERLLAAMPAAYARVVAHHVTLSVDGPADAPLPMELPGCVVGLADDGAGVQALVVEIGGTTQRPDGSAYHITWSLADGRKAVDSNDVIRRFGWTVLTERIPVRLRTPFRTSYRLAT